MTPHERIAVMLTQCGTPDGVLPPTALFNEGWMLRLVLDWAAGHPTAIDGLRFQEGSRWYSEALLGSRFRPRRRGDPAGEGFTHADGVIGHFIVRDGRGDIALLPDATQLTIVEAKMGSGLSAGTTRAPEFNQAARNVACMAHAVSEARLDTSKMNLGFVVLAPAARIEEGTFQLVERQSLCDAVTRRATEFDDTAVAWCRESFEPVAARCDIRVLSWESVLSDIEAENGDDAEHLRTFYEQCLRFNRAQRG